MIANSTAVDTFNIKPDRIMHLGYAFRASKVLLAATELDVFTTLAEEPLDLETLRERIGIDQRGARDLFDALVALRMLERDEDGRYGNTPETDRYLDRGKPTYVGGMLERLNAREYGIWASLTLALRTGKPQTTTAIGGYPALYSDPALLETFVKGMAGESLCAARSLAAKSAPASLNISTYIALATYGYTNIYELGPLLDVATTTLPFEESELHRAE